VVGADGGFTLKRLIPEFSKPGASKDGASEDGASEDGKPTWEMTNGPLDELDMAPAPYRVSKRGEVWDADGKFYGHREVGADGGFTLKRLIPEFSEHGATAKSPETKKWQPSRESQVNLGGNSCADENAKDYEDFQRIQKVCSTDVYEMDADRYERRQERFAAWQKAQDRRVLRTISEFCGE